MRQDPLRIGAVALAAGVSRDALPFYDDERRLLLNLIRALIRQSAELGHVLHQPGAKRGCELRVLLSRRWTTGDLNQPVE